MQSPSKWHITAVLYALLFTNLLLASLFINAADAPIYPHANWPGALKSCEEHDNCQP